MLFQSHSAAIFLILDFFKNVKIYSKKTIYLLKKKPNFWTFGEFYQFSRILWQLCYIQRFLKNWRVFFNDTSKFNKKPKFLTLNLLRILALPVAFFGNFAGSSNFSKRQNFFRKYHLCFERKTKFRKFLEILEIQSHSPANLQPSAICKLFMIFFERPIYFLLKKPKISTLNVLKIHAIPVAF